MNSSPRYQTLQTQDHLDHEEARADRQLDEDQGNQISGAETPQQPSFDQGPSPLPTDDGSAWDLQQKTAQIECVRPASKIDEDGSDPKMWTPFWLRQYTLLALGISFALMAIAVILLYHFSKTNNGLTVQEESRHYLWTFGPTALLTIFMSFWGQVHFSTRNLMPWEELHNGPVPAEKSVTLDYISPMFPEVIINSLQGKHWAIVASSVAVLLLKLTTTFSTGLIQLELTKYTENDIEMNIISKFNARKFNTEQQSISPIPGTIVYGALSQGLKYPTGTGPDAALEDFNPANPKARAGVYSSEVLGFSPSFDCETLIIANDSIVTRILPWYSISAKYFTVNITTADCKIDSAIVAMTADHGFLYRENTTQNFQGNFQNYTCNDGVDSSFDDRMRPDHTSYPEHRYLITMADLRWITTNGTSADPRHYWLQDLTAVLCRPSYTMDTYLASKSIQGNNSQATVTSKLLHKGTEDLTNFKVGKLAGAVTDSITNTKLGTGDEDYVITPVPSFFRILTAMNGGSRLEPFMDDNLLKDLGSIVWKAVAVQFARQYLMTPTEKASIGQATYNEMRLQVKLLSAVLMTVLLGMACCTTMFVWWSRPKPTLPRDPSPVAASVTLLATSPEFSQLMTGMGTLEVSRINHVTDGKTFRTNVSPKNFALEVLADQKVEEQLSQPLPTSESAFKWWNPLAAQSWFLLLATALSLIVAVLLIVLQHISDENQGLVDVTADSHVLPKYIPALVMLIIAALYSSIEGTSAIFAPFSKLKKGNASAAATIELSVTNKLLPHALVVSAKGGSFYYILSGFALLVAGFLTIIVSGLYTIISVPVNENATLTQTDTFNFGQGNLGIDDNSATATTGLLQYSNLSYPPWTYNNLVFNKLDAQLNLGAKGTLNANVMAYRAQLDCSTYLTRQKTIIPRSSISALGANADNIYVTMNTTVPIQCAHTFTEDETATWSQQYAIPFNRSSTYNGHSTLIRWNQPGLVVQGDGAIGHDIGNGVNLLYRNISTGNYGCPTFGFSLGTSTITPYGSTNSTLVDTSLTAVMCYQSLEQILANVTFDAADMSINVNHPPVPDESTVKKISNPSTSSEVWEWPINSFIANMRDLKQNATVPILGNKRNFLNDVDGFIQTLVDGTDGVPFDQLVGEENQHYLVDTASRLYSKYMAQAISTNMRNTISGNNQRNDTSTSYQAILISPERWRLRQNKGPAIALEVLLFTLAAASMAINFLWDRHEVLPHNPCSIAGTASLLAGSDLCTRKHIPDGAELLSAAERKTAGIFDDLKLRIGWYEDAENPAEKRFGIHVESPGV